MNENDERPLPRFSSCASIVTLWASYAERAPSSARSNVAVAVLQAERLFIRNRAVRQLACVNGRMFGDAGCKLVCEADIR
jgi:hypothetical protein